MKVRREKAPALTAASPTSAVDCHLATDQAAPAEAGLTGLGTESRSALN
jgi:hypothetical protein